MSKRFIVEKKKRGKTMIKHVLVTGAGGYIGTVLVPKLLEAGYRVTAIDRFYFGMNKLQPHPQLKTIKEDCRSLKETHFLDVDVVIDLAALSNDPSGEIFQQVTYDVNFVARVHTANLARKMGVKRYILPSSCSVYGFQDKATVLTEESTTNPLTVYAKANEMAERGVLQLHTKTFTVIVLRLATVFGYSPRMRFDLAVNGMTYGAWKNGVIPLMRNGTQWRPFIHIEDVTDVIRTMVKVDARVVNGEIFNVGANDHNFELRTLAEKIVCALPKNVYIEWYGDPDARSYRVDFSKLENRLGWQRKHSVSSAVREIFDLLERGKLAKTPETITLDWYQELQKWKKIIAETEMYGGILEMNEQKEIPHVLISKTSSKMKSN